MYRCETIKSRSVREMAFGDFVGRIGPVCSGLLANLFANPIHEGGHFLAAKALGYGAHMEGLLPWNSHPMTQIPGLEESGFGDNLITLGAPLAEYATAITLSSVGKRISNRFLRTSAKVASTFLGFEPLLYSVGSYFDQVGSASDYVVLAKNGIGYEITIPAAAVLGLANAYFAWREKPRQNRRSTA